VLPLQLLLMPRGLDDDYESDEDVWDEDMIEEEEGEDEQPEPEEDDMSISDTTLELLSYILWISNTHC